MNADELDPKKHYDPVFLFIRSDERLALVESDQSDLANNVTQHKVYIDKKFDEQNGQIDYLIKRMDGQVSKTGHDNTAAIGDLTKQLALVENDVRQLHEKLFDKDTGLMKQFENLRDWVSAINKLAMGFMVTGVAGALILWAVKHFAP